MNERILNTPEARYRIMRLERERERDAKVMRDHLMGISDDKIRDVIFGKAPPKKDVFTVNLTADDSKFREALMQRPIRAKPADTPGWQEFRPYKRERY